MRYIVLVLFIVLVSGIAHGYPLQASNGVVNCTIFGFFPDPWPAGSANADSYFVLNVDLSLTRINVSDNTPIRAVYSLKDGNDRLFKTSKDYTKELQPGRWLIGFVVPRETIARNLIVDLSGDPASGEQFSLRFPELINSSDGNVTLLYYGVLRSRISSNKKTIVLDTALTNNGTLELPIQARNFTLKDQWGWKYNGNQYNVLGSKGTSKVVLEPNGTVRAGLIFSSLSPISRPVELIYQFSNNSSLALDIDPESGLCPGRKALCSNSECNHTEEQAAAASLAGSLKSSKGLLDRSDENAAGNSVARKGRDDL
jgi:hypothetical protein